MQDCAIVDGPLLFNPLWLYSWPLFCFTLELICQPDASMPPVFTVWVPVFCCVQKLYSAMQRSPNLLYSVAAVFCSYWESGISQTALQEAWLNLPPHSHTQFLHQWWWWPWWQWWWQRCKLQWRYWQLISKGGSWHLAHQLRWNGTGQYPPPPLHWNPKDSTI